MLYVKGRLFATIVFALVKHESMQARHQLRHVYDEAALSWTVAIWAATTIQRRWKGFIARRAYLRDRRQRWVAKRSESLRLHQDRRWKWMDTKDQVLARQRSPECEVWQLFVWCFSPLLAGVGQ